MYTKDVDKKRMRKTSNKNQKFCSFSICSPPTRRRKIVLNHTSCNDHGVKCIKFSRTITRAHLRKKEVVYTHVDRLITTRGQIETDGQRVS